MKSAAVAKLLQGFGAPRGLKPEWMPPSFARRAGTPPHGGEWLHERKYEGIRVQCHLENGAARILTAHGRDWTAKFPGLGEALASLKANEAVLDGELVAFDGKGAISYNALIRFLRYRASAHLLIVFFDLLHVDGYDVAALPLLERKKVLRSLLEQRVVSRNAVRFSEHILGHGDVLFRQACNQMWDGLVSKRYDAPYREGTEWVESACVHRRPLLVAGVDRDNARAPALILGAFDESGVFRYRGRVSSGVAPLLRSGFDKQLEAARTDLPTLDLPSGVSGRKISWVNAGISVSVRYRELTAEQFVRRARVEGASDASPREVIWPTGTGVRVASNAA